MQVGGWGCECTVGCLTRAALDGSDWVSTWLRKAYLEDNVAMRVGGQSRECAGAMGVLQEGNRGWWC
jgi:hypothetical protein